MKYSLISLLFISMFIFSCKSSKKSVDSGGTIIKNGTSKYSIIIPTNASLPEKRAGEQLQKYLQQISDVKLRLQYDRVPERPTEILVGNTNRKATTTLKKQSIDLGTDGFHVKTIDGKLVFVGGSKSGVEYGVYSYLEKYHDCRYFNNLEIVIPKKKEIGLGNIDLQETPAFEFRDNFYKPTLGAYTHWHKLDHVISRKEWSDYWGHTFERMISDKQYFNSHPEYFSFHEGRRIPNGQLCTTNSDVFEIVVETLRKKMKADGNKKYYSVSQNDRGKYCQCDNCAAINERAGAPSGAILTFVNKVAAEFPDKVISTLAYTYSRKPPKHIRPAKNVQIVLAPIEANRSQPIATDPKTASFRRDLEGWQKLTNNILIWDYVINFSHLMAPYPNLRALQPNFQYFQKYKIHSMFTQGNWEIGGEFAELRTYLISKLMWNPNINFDKTMDEFLNGYYGAAGSSIKKYINSMHDALENSNAELHIYDDPELAYTTYLSPKMIAQYNEIFAKAENAVRNQTKYLERVKVARLSLKYAELELQKGNLKGFQKAYSIGKSKKPIVEKSYEKDLASFVKASEKAGIERLKEYGTSPREYYDKSISKIKSTQVSKRSLSAATSIKSFIKPSPKFRGGDPNTLIDGLKGNRLQHAKDWLGFEGTDMKVILDFNKQKPVNKVKLDVMKNIGFSIMEPVRVNFSISNDGKNFTPIGGIKKSFSDNISGVFIMTFETPKLQSKTAQYLQVEIINMKKLPDWHPKKGQPAWLFVDEIVVE